MHSLCSPLSHSTWNSGHGAAHKGIFGKRAIRRILNVCQDTKVACLTNILPYHRDKEDVFVVNLNGYSIGMYDLTMVHIFFLLISRIVNNVQFWFVLLNLVVSNSSTIILLLLTIQNRLIKLKKNVDCSKCLKILVKKTHFKISPREIPFQLVEKLFNFTNYKLQINNKPPALPLEVNIWTLLFTGHFHENFHS